jgi:glutamyl-tRNA synthetase
MKRVRFAPSPTGYLHLGNIRTALFNYLYARRHGGKFILRIEDTDSQRSRPEYEKGLLEDLRWMGLQWDEGPEAGGEYGPYRQSERFEIYQRHAQELIKKGKAYYCYVTEEEVEEMKQRAKLEKRPLRFSNPGRHFSEQEIERRKAMGIKPAVRFMIKEPQLIMYDLIRGVVKFNLDDMIGDFIILKPDGTPTFHLAVCVDDGMMKITHVIRGEDHLSNAPRHILLMEAMGYTPPQYGHLPLIHGPGGEPLSKRLESVSVRSFRGQGYMGESLANYIALLGWAPGDNRELYSISELEKVFDLDRVGKSASCYDPQKLDWVSGEHLRMLSDEEFTRRAMDYLKINGKLSGNWGRTERVLPILKDKIVRFDQLTEMLSFLNEDLAYEHQDVLKGEEAAEIFEQALKILPSLSDADPALYDSFLNAIKPSVKAKGKNLFMPIRIALTGKEHGPELKRLFPALGLETIRHRFERALKETAKQS